MSGAEVAHRVRDAAVVSAWRTRSAWRAPRPMDRKDAVPPTPWPVDGLAASEWLAWVHATARSVASGRYKLLGIDIDEPEPDWHLDPKSGIRPPLDFGPSLDYRDPQLAGSAKNIWEKNRHQQLVLLALSAAVRDDVVHRRLLVRQVTSWVDQNPVPKGINWCSGLELGVRLIAWTWIDRLLRGRHEHGELFGPSGALRDAIYWHQWMIRRKPSHGSSSNNHLVGELCGLFLATLQWPAWSESRGWHEWARRGLEREVARQTFESGLNREMAAAYHLFVLEFSLLAGIEAGRDGRPLSSRYRDTVRKMLGVLDRLTDVGGNFPTYGDGDDGMALWLAPDTPSRIAWLQEAGGRWLEEPVPPRPTAMAGELLLPGRPAPRAFASSSPNAESFVDAGVYILTRERGTPRELFSVAHAGPLGFLSIAGHGHCHALSFTLSVGGHPVFIDPGTYAYHDEVEWRNYFRSTAAHNTIRIDGLEQSEPGGLFLYRSKAECHVSRFESAPGRASLEASHDGYSRLSAPVLHRRRLALDGRRVSVDDSLEGRGEHLVEWFLHMHPSCEASLEDMTLNVAWSTGRLAVALDSQLDWSLLHGGREGGWCSPSFNVRRPTWTLRGKATAGLPLRLESSIHVYDHEIGD